METKEMNEIISTEFNLYMDELSRIHDLYQKIKYNCSTIPDEVIENAWFNNLSFHFNVNGEFLFANINEILGYTCLPHPIVKTPTLESLWECADRMMDAQLNFIGDMAYFLLAKESDDSP